MGERGRERDPSAADGGRGEPTSVVEADMAASAVPDVDRPVPRWVAPAFLVLGIALVPWTVALALTLPTRHGTHHYDVSWTGFDLALAITLTATAIGAARNAPWLQGSSTAAATLLVCDAWFDVLSSTSERELVESTVLALFVELPVAAACIFVARHAEETAVRARTYAAFYGRLRRRQPPQHNA